MPKTSPKPPSPTRTREFFLLLFVGAVLVFLLLQFCGPQIRSWLEPTASLPCSLAEGL